MSERGFLIHGRVQGVGFRWWTHRTAERLGVVGSVRNRRDGSVEVMARAEDGVLERFENELRKGPPSARVEEIEEVACTLRGDADSFRIAH